jgi:hypothetical protein
MKDELTMMREFEVATGVSPDRLTAYELRNALDFRFVHRWKGSAVKSRLCIRGYKQQVHDEDTVFASTPSLSSLKLFFSRRQQVFEA